MLASMVNPNIPSFGQGTNIPGEFVAEQRHDPFLNPTETVHKLSQTQGVEAPGHIAHRGIADKIHKQFLARQGGTIVSQAGVSTETVPPTDTLFR